MKHGATLFNMVSKDMEYVGPMMLNTIVSLSCSAGFKVKGLFIVEVHLSS